VSSSISGASARRPAQPGDDQYQGDGDGTCRDRRTENK